MLTLRTALAATLAVLLAACGSALVESDQGDSIAANPDPRANTTLVPGSVIEDPPLPTAPPVPDRTSNPDGDGDADGATEGTDDDPEGDTDVFVYFVVEPDSGLDGTDIGCGLAAPVIRRVQSPHVLSGAIGALLEGPTGRELDAGYGTVLGDVGWEVASVTITEGTALIDFSEDSQPFNNISASCVHLPLMAQLEMTAMQFPTVDRAVFSVGGDIATFYHWLERDVPEI